MTAKQPMQLPDLERPEVQEAQRKLMERFNCTGQQLREAIKPLFFLMFKSGIQRVVVTRNGALIDLRIE